MERLLVMQGPIVTTVFGADPQTWLFTGDSITQGAQHTHGWRSFPQHFEERVRYEMRRMSDTVINSAISGNETFDLLPAFEGRVARFRPTVVLLMLGTNDAVRGPNGEERFRSNLARLVDDIGALGSVAILQTPPPVRSTASSSVHLARYVEIVRGLAVERGVALVDHYAAWGAGEPPDAWMNDAIHPNERGHLAMAKTLFEALGIFDPASATCGLAIR